MGLKVVFFHDFNCLIFSSLNYSIFLLRLFLAWFLVSKLSNFRFFTVEFIFLINVMFFLVIIFEEVFNTFLLTIFWRSLQPSWTNNILQFTFWQNQVFINVMIFLLIIFEEVFITFLLIIFEEVFNQVEQTIFFNFHFDETKFWILCLKVVLSCIYKYFIMSKI